MKRVREFSLVLSVCAFATYAAQGRDGGEVSGLSRDSVAKAVRLQKAKALAALGPQTISAAPGLITLLDDNELEIVKTVESALAAMGREAAPALSRALSDNNQRRRARAAALLLLSDPNHLASIRVLTRVLREADPADQAEAATALASIAPGCRPDVIPALVEATRGRDARVRAKAAWALGRPDENSTLALSALISTLEDQDAEVRTQAAIALGNIRKFAAPAVEPLLKASRDKDRNVRVYAIAALGGVAPADKRIIQRFLKALESEDVEVRRMAIIQLCSSAGAAKKEDVPVEALLKAIMDNDPTVR
jgi:HEAT repeat protein